VDLSSRVPRTTKPIDFRCELPTFSGETPKLLVEIGDCALTRTREPSKCSDRLILGEARDDIGSQPHLALWIFRVPDGAKRILKGPGNDIVVVLWLPDRPKVCSEERSNRKLTLSGYTVS
jgi:hypothetical protein